MAPVYAPTSWNAAMTSSKYFAPRGKRGESERAKPMASTPSTPPCCPTGRRFPPQVVCSPSRRRKTTRKRRVCRAHRGRPGHGSLCGCPPPRRSLRIPACLHLSHRKPAVPGSDARHYTDGGAIEALRFRGAPRLLLGHGWRLGASAAGATCLSKVSLAATVGV